MPRGGLYITTCYRGILWNRYHQIPMHWGWLMVGEKPHVGWQPKWLYFQAQTFQLGSHPTAPCSLAQCNTYIHHYTAHFTLYLLHCSLQTYQCTQSTVQCTLNTEHCILSTVDCTYLQSNSCPMGWHFGLLSAAFASTSSLSWCRKSYPKKLFPPMDNMIPFTSLCARCHPWTTRSPLQTWDQ